MCLADRADREREAPNHSVNRAKRQRLQLRCRFPGTNPAASPWPEARFLVRRAVLAIYHRQRVCEFGSTVVR
jgi:hypothetical protein